MSSGAVVCAACGYVGPPRRYGCTRVGILLFLLMLGIIPGIIYAVWADAYVKRCPQCDQKAVIPADSPRGRELLANKTR